MKKTSTVWVIAIVAIITMVFVSCDSPEEKAAKAAAQAVAQAEKEAAEAVDNLVKIFQGYDNIAKVEALKNATPDAIKNLIASNTSPGGDFSYDLNEAGDGIIIKRYTGSNEVVIYPAEIEGYPVVEVRGASSKRFSIVIIPEGVKSISGFGYVYGSNLYSGEVLRSVVLPASLETIGDETFYKCENLTTVTIPDGVKTIGYRAFAECFNLSTITVGNGVAIIGNEAFQGCPVLRTVALPDTVEQIGERAFGGCKSLHTINIPAGIKTIDKFAFSGCGELYNLTIPDSITNIQFLIEKIQVLYQGQSNAFKGCGKLQIATRKRLQDLGYKDTF